MRKLIVLALIGMVHIQGMAVPVGRDKKLHIIPEPVAVQINAGYFQLDRKTRIISTAKKTTDVAQMMKELLNTPTGFHLTIKDENTVQADHAIIFKLNARPDTTLGKEGYTLKVTPQKVLIEANEATGLFYGMQTLMQLLPPEIQRTGPTKSVDWRIPCVSVLDYPRFSWRGLMLDVSRHFFSKAFVEQYIDQMAKYKFNVFHWHLSDDQGWRIQIRGLPRLTDVGAWRVPRTGHWGFKPPRPGEKATYGGFYTQQDIREIVAYAQRRFVKIVPEVDVPAHSLALIASYPNLSCTQLQYPVNPGSAFSGDNVLCIANDSTWLILDKIFTQIAELFPGDYIHVGGDEANRSFWAKDPRDQALMRKEGITSPAGLQSYFEKKLEKIITSKGKKMIGWDEILEGGLAPEATVMSWRGTEGGIHAAKMGHHVVMTPDRYCYLDHYQGDPLVEPSFVVPITTRLSTCYQFEPVPAGVDPKYILGGQGNLWAEFVPNERQAEYMTWPRGLALAEVLWSPSNKRDWAGFVQRMDWQFKYMDAAQVRYARSAFDPIISGVKDSGGIMKVKLATEIPGLAIYYTFDGTNPDNFYPRYEGKPLDIPTGATEIRVITYQDGKPIGRQINCPVTVIAKRTPK
jgi:hexosaminidase